LLIRNGFVLPCRADTGGGDWDGVGDVRLEIDGQADKVVAVAPIAPGFYPAENILFF